MEHLQGSSRFRFFRNRRNKHPPVHWQSHIVDNSTGAETHTAGSNDDVHRLWPGI
jgi:hypothetical protein